MIIRPCSRRSYSSAATASLDSSKPFPFFPSQCSTLIPLIRSCRNLRSLLQIHAQLLTRGIEPNDSLLTLLVNCYSSFGRPDSSLSVFNLSPNPPCVLWNSMIRSFARSGDHPEAIRLYRSMLRQGVDPDKYTFTFVLKSCAGSLDSGTGIPIHGEVARRNLQGDPHIATALLDMYSRLGMVETASQLFDLMPEWDVVSCNAMIGGFSNNNQPHRALALFAKMPAAGITSNRVTVLNLFPAICELSDSLLCRSLHGFIARRLLLPATANGLIDAYSKCGLVEPARRTFDAMLDSRDDVSWATMISGYCYNDCFEDALELFDELQMGNAKPNQVSIISALSAAAETRNLKKGVEIYEHAAEKGARLDVSATTMLVTMLAKCGDAEKAKSAFDGMPAKDIVAWSATISAFAQSGRPKDAVSVFEKMIREGVAPNGITVMSLLPACADLLDLDLGRSVHGISLKSHVRFDRSVGTAFVAMYAQCGSFVPALKMFEILPDRDIVAWNALINGYVQNGDADKAMETFSELAIAGLKPDRGTLVGVLSACAISNNLRAGICVHGLVVKLGFGSGLQVKNATMDMYVKCGEFKAAETIFRETKPYFDVVAWNTMIAGYARGGLANKAISVFCQMRAENIRPNLVTLVSIIPTSALLSSLKDGLILQSIAVRTGFDSHTPVGNSLIDMYSKCGRLDLARRAFDLMNHRDTVSWNAMLAGYAMHGDGESAVELFSRMKESGVWPDSVSLIGVLSACRHGGFVEDGRRIFGSMRHELCIEPNRKHRACMVDLLGRAGYFDEARELIEGMGNEDDAAAVWGALLGAAEIHSQVKMGELAAEQLARLEPQSPSHYVILSNIYADLGRWADAGRMRAVIRDMGLSQSPGSSWVEN